MILDPNGTNLLRGRIIVLTWILDLLQEVVQRGKRFPGKNTTSFGDLNH